jgi:hypothetical protein
MRWDALFADVEAVAAAEGEAERRLEVADRSRFELGRLRLIDRLQPALQAGAALKVGLVGHPALRGAVRGLGVDWLLLGQEAGVESLIALDAVETIQGLTAASAEPGWEGLVGARLDLRVVLRRVLRDRSAVAVALSSGDTVSGRLSRVGADHLEMTASRGADHGSDHGAGADWTVPLKAVVFVQRR